MKWHDSDKFRKAWSIIRLVFKLLLLAGIMIFLAVALNDPANKQHTVYLYLSIGVLSAFLIAVIFFTHRKHND